MEVFSIARGFHYMWKEYGKALKKHASPYNGKLMKEFEDIYDELHIAGYYRGCSTTSLTVMARHFRPT